MKRSFGMFGFVAAVALMLGAVVPAQAIAVPWINGDFELGDTTWSFPGTTTFVDADDDGDLEAKLAGCGEGTWQLSRGASKLIVPATSHVAFDVERGSLQYGIRAILISVENFDRWANNLLNSVGPASPTYDDAYWFDDQVLSWDNWSGSSGHVDLDPADAVAYNIDGWDDMTRDERIAFLSTTVHITTVVYGCAAGFEGGATLDNFAWEIPA